jgi:PST family polysaccharide transporter
MLAGMTWRFVGLYSRAFLNLFVLATLSRLLSPQDFGVMGVATIFIGLAEIFSQLGVGPALVQRPDLNPKHMRVAFTLAVLMGTVMLLMLWVAAPFIALFFRDDKIAAVLCGVSFTFLLRGFGAVPQALLRRELQFKKLMWVDLASYTLGYAVVGLTMAWSGYGVWSLVGATLSQSLVQSVMLLITERPPLKPSFARQELKDLVYFGGGVTLARLFNFAAGKGDYFVVGRALGVEPLGMYTRAYRLMNLPANYLGRVLDTVLFPVMGKIQHQLPRLTKSYLTGVAMIGLVCAPVGVLMVVMAPELVGVVLGSQWSEAVIPLQVLALGVLPRVSYKIDNSLAKAMGAVYRRSARDAVYAAAVIVGSMVGLRWGLPGVAVGVLGALILNNVMAFRMSLSLLGCSFTQYVRAQLPGLIIALIAAGVAFPTRRLLHSHGMPDLVTLALTSAVSCLVVGALFLWRPREIAGRYGTDAVIMVFRSIPDRFFPRIVLQWFNTRVAGSAL